MADLHVELYDHRFRDLRLMQKQLSGLFFFFLNAQVFQPASLVGGELKLYQLRGEFTFNKTPRSMYLRRIFTNMISTGPCSTFINDMQVWNG